MIPLRVSEGLPHRLLVPVVSVIIPTTCELARKLLIERALDSVVSQEGVVVETIVVVNGSRLDTGLYESLARDSRLRVVYIAEGHVSRARLHGLSMSTGEFFSFLDDDDELLPLALKKRTEIFAAERMIDVVVTNGFIHDGRDHLMVEKALEREIQEAQNESFLKHNWFASPSSMFRRMTVDTEIFNIPFRYFEWTYLFFRLVSAGKHIHFDGSITYRKYEDNPLSVSKSREYHLSLSDFLRDVMALSLPQELSDGVRHKYIAALNRVSTLYLSDYEFGKALSYHARCVLAGGWRYTPYTRRILSSYLRSFFRGRS